MKYFVHQQKYVFFWKVSESRNEETEESKGKREKREAGEIDDGRKEEQTEVKKERKRG